MSPNSQPESAGLQPQQRFNWNPIARWKELKRCERELNRTHLDKEDEYARQAREGTWWAAQRKKPAQDVHVILRRTGDVAFLVGEDGVDALEWPRPEFLTWKNLMEFWQNCKDKV